MILAHILIATTIGITRLNIKEGFSIIKQIQAYDSNLDVLIGYAEIFDNCMVAIVCVVLYWWLGSQFLFKLMFYIHEVWKKKGLYSVLIFTLVSGMFGFMSHLDESILEIFFYNNYFILHHVLLDVGIFPTMINICTMLLLPNCIEGVEKKVWQGKDNIVDWDISLQIGILVILLIINHIGGKRCGNCN